MTTTWTDIASLIEARGGVRCYQHGNERAWKVPHSTGGTFRVEVTLRPRWCSLGVDRWHTSNRDQLLAGPWFKEHIWPFIERAGHWRRAALFLPNGGPTYTGATGIDRADLLAVLELWIDAELAWGTKPAEAS